VCGEKECQGKKGMEATIIPISAISFFQGKEYNI
jgi:hypothetical protein